MEGKLCNTLAVLTTLVLFHLSTDTEGKPEPYGAQYAQNVIRNVSSGYGGQRGSGASSGSGSAGTLPPCRECFGHGSNPNSDPRCQLGCRGVADNVPATQLPAIMQKGCFGGGKCHHGVTVERPGRQDKTSSTLKTGLVVGTLAICILIVIAVIIKRFRQKSTVGVHSSYDGHEVNAVQTV